MTNRENYRYEIEPGASLENADAVLATLQCRGAQRLTIDVEATVASDFTLQVDFGDGTFVPFDSSYTSTDTINDVQDLTVARVRLVNATAQTASDTADVRLGAA
jgi:hypothetical protein